MSIERYEQFLKQNVPMIEYSKLSIVHLDDQKCIIKMPFISQNKNHVNSMYFGSIAIGTEVAAGILGLHYLERYNLMPLLVFKDISGSFLRRSESDTYFICNDYHSIAQAVKDLIESKGRVNVSVNVIGVTDLNNLDEKISDFKITISIKYQPQDSK